MGEVVSYVKESIDELLLSAAIVDGDLVLTKLGGGIITIPLADAGVSQETLDAAIAAVVDSAPGLLNTLNELAAALGDDPNFATTVLNGLAALDTRVDTLEAVGGDTENIYSGGNVGASRTLDLSNGEAQRFTLDQNSTIVFPAGLSLTEVHRILLELVQDATGGRSVTFAGSAPGVEQAADDFNRADGALNGQTSSSGDVWSASGFSTLNNELASTSSSDHTARLEVGSSEQDVSIVLRNGAGSRATGVALRMNAARTRYLAVVAASGVGGVGCYEFNNGYVQNLFGNNGVTWADGDVMRVTISGTTLTIFKNGVQVAQTSSAPNYNETGAGVYSQSTVDRYDTFSAKTLGSAIVYRGFVSVDTVANAKTVFEGRTTDGGQTWILDQLYPTPAGLATQAELDAVIDSLSKISAISIDAARTLSAADKGQSIDFTGSTARVLTIDTNANQAIDTTTVFEVNRLGTGTVTIDAVAGVTLNGVDGGSCTIQTQYEGVSLRKIGTNAWQVKGDISAVA